MLIENLAQAIAANEHTLGFYTDCRAQVVNLLDDGQAPPVVEGTVPASGRVLFRGDSFAGARVAVVAHWSADGVPDAALQYLLRALREQGYRVVAACGCEPQHLEVWSGLVEALVCRQSTGYDFTSWKTALAVLPDLLDADELVCCNDSVYGPVMPLGPVHTAMNAVDCDFWGMVESREKRLHLQSFYLVFRKNVLRHPAFTAFWQAVDTNPDKFATVLRYEMGLSPWLASQGLIPAAYVPAACFPRTNVNPCHYFWRPLLERFAMPFLKRDLIRRAGSHAFLSGWQQILADHGFDPALCAVRPELQDALIKSALRL